MQIWEQFCSREISTLCLILVLIDSRAKLWFDNVVCATETKGIGKRRLPRPSLWRGNYPSGGWSLLRSFWMPEYIP